MRIGLRILGPLRVYLRDAPAHLVLAPGATPAELLAALDPPPWVHRGPLLILVNRHPADISTPLKDGDQVIFMLPAGGG